MPAAVDACGILSQYEAGSVLSQGEWPQVLCPSAETSCIGSPGRYGQYSVAAHSLVAAATSGQDHSCGIFSHFLRHSPWPWQWPVCLPQLWDHKLKLHLVLPLALVPSLMYLPWSRRLQPAHPTYGICKGGSCDLRAEGVRAFPSQ